jgi:hypothetical protein
MSPFIIHQSPFIITGNPASRGPTTSLPSPLAAAATQRSGPGMRALPHSPVIAHQSPFIPHHQCRLASISVPSAFPSPMQCPYLRAFALRVKHQEPSIHREYWKSGLLWTNDSPHLQVSPSPTPIFCHATFRQNPEKSAARTFVPTPYAVDTCKNHFSQEIHFCTHPLQQAKSAPQFHPLVPQRLIYRSKTTRFLRIR